MGVSHLNRITLTFNDKSGVERLIALMQRGEELRLPGYNPMLDDYSMEELAEMNEWFLGLPDHMKDFMFRVPEGTACDSILDALNLWNPPVDSYTVSYDGRVIQVETLYGSFDLKRWGLLEDATFLGGSSFVSDLQWDDEDDTFGTFTPEDLNNHGWNNQVKGSFRCVTKRGVNRKTEEHTRELLFAVV